MIFAQLAEPAGRIYVRRSPAPC